ncbi:MAG TPA: hypothetical protein VNG93_13285 [Candidatus Dormibacteraeota bacterium]|nr:hypothetical protein [Candidatus Dormibacteraeota bacterium]
MLDASRLEVALSTLGRLLSERGLCYELVAVGGSGLLMLGLTVRPTRDLDIVALVEKGQYVKLRNLPGPLLAAVREVAQIEGLAPNWINPGPADLLDFGLPEGFAERTETKRYGPLVFHVASRIDQVALKVYAAADAGPRSKHFQDLANLSPSHSELIKAGRWAVTHDTSDAFRAQLVGCLVALGVEDAGDRL